MKQVRAIVFVALVLAVFSQTAVAQSYNAGYTKYQHADFDGAERAMQNALAHEKTPSVLAKVYKILGICQYMRGDKAAAKDSFREAFTNDPGISIARGEVLDDSIIDFFGKARPAGLAASPADAKAAAAPVLPGLPAPLAEQGAEKPMFVPPTPTFGKKGGKAKDTAKDAAAEAAAKRCGLKIIANVEDASVLIDDIVAGPVNAIIKYPPGSYLVEIKAAGYVTKKRKVTLIAGKVVKFKVKLKKKKAAKPVDELADVHPEDPAALAESKAGSEEPKPLVAADNPEAAAEGEQPAKSADSAEANPNKQEASSSDDGKSSVLLALLPFGVGQFQNGQGLLGFTFLAAEAGSLYFYNSRSSAAASAQATGNQLANSGQPLTPADESYLSTNATYVAAQRKQAKYGEIAFGVLWASGVAQALLYTPPPAKKHDERDQHYPGFYSYTPDRAGFLPTCDGGAEFKVAWDW